MKLITLLSIMLALAWAGQDAHDRAGGEATNAPNDNAQTAQPPAQADVTLAAYHSGVIGGPHDFSGSTGLPGDACSACHVPHLAAIGPAVTPQSTSGSDSSESQASTTPAGTDETGDDKVWPVATGTQRQAQLFKIEPQRPVFTADMYIPGPTSMVCLSCHDGTVATSTIDSAHAILAGLREGFALGPDYALHDHPIGIEYPRADREYRPKSFVLATGVVRLPGGRVECDSCHDPHNKYGIDGMLVMSNRRSALCLTCHKK